MDGGTVSSGIPDDRNVRPGTVSGWPLDATAAQRIRDYLLSRAQGSRELLDGRDLDFRGADLSSMDLEGARIMRASLDAVNFGGAILADADLSDASAVGTRFDRAEAMGANFSGLNASTASFAGAELGGLEAMNANFTSADFHGANLRGAAFWDCIMTSVDLRDTLLERTKFYNSRLTGAHVAGASGTASGPSQVADDVILDAQELEQWFRERGADVRIVPMDPREDA
jgi:uncharacterized protein YjbI with pentapeptide repeats